MYSVALQTVLYTDYSSVEVCLSQLIYSSLSLSLLWSFFVILSCSVSPWLFDCFGGISIDSVMPLIDAKNQTSHHSHGTVLCDRLVTAHPLAHNAQLRLIDISKFLTSYLSICVVKLRLLSAVYHITSISINQTIPISALHCITPHRIGSHRCHTLTSSDARITA